MNDFVTVIARVQYLAAAERAVATQLGARAPDATPDRKVLLAQLVRHAAWRAEQWESLGPTVETLVVAGLGEFADTFDGFGSTPDPIAAVSTVFDQLVAVAEELAASDPVGLAPVRRVAARVGQDLAADQALVDGARAEQPTGP